MTEIGLFDLEDLLGGEKLRVALESPGRDLLHTRSVELLAKIPGVRVHKTEGGGRSIRVVHRKCTKGPKSPFWVVLCL